MNHEIYFSSTLMWDALIEEMIEQAVTGGMTGIELWAQHVEAKQINLDAYRFLSEREKIKTIIHSKSWDLNFASMNREIRKASIREIKSSIDMANMAGAVEVTVHPPKMTTGQDIQEYEELAYEGICVLDTYARKSGVRISLEVMENIPREVAVSIDGMKKITRDHFNELAYTVDLAHCDYEELFWELLYGLPNISKIHVSNRMGNKLHTCLDEGDYDIVRIVDEVSKPLPIVMEGFDAGCSFEKIKRNINYIKKLNQTAVLEA